MRQSILNWIKHFWSGFQSKEVRVSSSFLPFDKVLKADLQRHKFNVAVIPGGLTPVLQLLDRCLNKPFKDNIRQQYLSWIMTAPFEFTSAGKKKAQSRNLVLKWVKQSWAEIPAEMVR